MQKARIRADKKVLPPKVIRGTRHSPPAEAVLERKPSEIGLHVVEREMGLYDGEESEIEADLLPPAEGNGEAEFDAQAMALKMFG